MTSIKIHIYQNVFCQRLLVAVRSYYNYIFSSCNQRSHYYPNFKDFNK